MGFAILFGLAVAAAAFAASSSAKAGKNYRLISAEERARKNPQTFRIPTLPKRQALKAQQFAKLLFAVPAGPNQPDAERMWVEVTGFFKTGTFVRYTGKLDNDPGFIPGLKAGDTITFGPEHVADILVRKVHLNQ